MNKPKLLILDDDPLAGQPIQSIAEFAGFEVRFVLEPVPFFDQMQEWKPDFIVLDLVMPEMDGVMVMEELAARECDARLIITSGVGGRVLDAAARAAREHGLKVQGVLAKPFTPAALRNLLNHPLESHSNSPCKKKAPPIMPGIEQLHAALEEQRLEVYLQPKVSCTSYRLAGFEVLVRWQELESGFVPPDHFVPIAEREGLIGALTRQVVEQALSWFASRHPGSGECVDNAAFDRCSLVSGLHLSINISAASMPDTALFDWIEQRCRELDIPPRRITFELTETSAMEDATATLNVLTRLRVKGFQLSIDDFGTGFSSMLQLVRLPFSEIKVDKSFVLTALRSQESRSVIKSIIDLGHSLGLQTTAEGIEDAETFSYLQQAGCDLAQGFHIARPMPLKAVDAWLDQHLVEQEEKRLTALRQLNLLDTPREERFDRITRTACKAFNVPKAIITLVDRERQWFKSEQGQNAYETPRNISFCHHAILGDEVMIVPDARLDPRFRNMSPVTGKDPVRFYAGCPLEIRGGHRVGTLCIVDTRPRRFSAEDAAILKDLARLVESEIMATSLDQIEPATALLNQVGFETRATDALTFCLRLNLPITLCLFKLGNYPSETSTDSRQGDRAQAQFARILREEVRDADIIGQLGEHEFALLLVDAALDGGTETCSRICNRLEQLDKLPHPLNCHSAVEVFSTTRQDSLTQLLRRAEAQLENNR
jgi:diguanylate cyclase (GGDEF)-like protein